MDDYLNEDDQWQAVKRWLKENGPWIAGGVVIAMAGIYGWRGYQDRLTAQAYAAADLYAQVAADLQSDNRAKAQAAAARLQQEYANTPYADKADLVLARDEVEHNELDKAVTRLKGILERTKDEPLKQVVRLRLARVILAQNKPDEALAALGSLKADEKDSAFASSHHEVRGDILLAKGDRNGALAAYKEAMQAGEPGDGGESQLQLKLNDLLATQTASTLPESKP